VPLTPILAAVVRTHQTKAVSGCTGVGDACKAQRPTSINCRVLHPYMASRRVLLVYIEIHVENASAWPKVSEREVVTLCGQTQA